MLLCGLSLSEKDGIFKQPGQHKGICVGGVEFPTDANAPVRTVQILEVADFVCAHGSQVCAEPTIDPATETLPHFHMRGGPILTDMFGQSFDWIL